jgi:thiol:disulfide interchange protein
VLREVATSRCASLLSLALVASGMGCGTAPGLTAPGVSAASNLLVIPVDDSAPSLASVASASAPSSSPRSSPRSTAIAWMTSERDARDRARQQNLPLLVYVRASWAAPCIAMERDAWIDPRVVEATRRFVPLQLDVTEADENAELYAQRYGVDRMPEILVVDPAGRTLATSGARTSADSLAAFLRDVSGE